MAQTGYTPILIYASGTSTNVPLAANLTSGASGAELALNYADGKLFYKDSGGTVQVLATKGSAVIGGSNTQVQYNSSGSLAGSANMTFDGTKLTVAGLKDSALTSGRVTYATTSGELTDSANLTFNGTNLGLGISSTNDTFVIYSATTPGMRFYNSTTGTLSSDGSQIYVSGNDFLFINRESAAVYTGTANTIRTTLDASGNFGIGTMSPSATLDVSGTAKVSGAVTLSGGTANGVLYLDGSKVATSGSALTFDGSNLTLTGNLYMTGGSIAFDDERFVYSYAGGSLGQYMSGVYYDGSGLNQRFYLNNAEQMRLTSTGLGIGTSSPSGKLQVKGTVNFEATNSTNVWNLYTYTDNTLRWNYNGAGADEIVLDSSGNLGLGVTPSAWSTGKAFELNNLGNGLWANGANDLSVGSNFYYNAGYKFAGTGYATWYQNGSASGKHVWSVSSASGTAGNAITWVNAMTLGASGNLGIGTTAPGYKLEVQTTTTSPGLWV